MAENPATDVGGDDPSASQGDYEYDEAQEAAAGSSDSATAEPPVSPPPNVDVGEGGDYGYDEAHDLGRG